MSLPPCPPPLISLTAAQAAALRTELQQIDVARGLHLYTHPSTGDTLRVGSDGWPGEVRIDAAGAATELLEEGDL